MALSVRAASVLTLDGAHSASLQCVGPIPSVSELLFGLEAFRLLASCLLSPASGRRGVRTSPSSPVSDPSTATRSDGQELAYAQTLCVPLGTEANLARLSGRMSTGSGFTLQLTHTRDVVQQRSACEIAPKANLSISG